jgi:hypothetical protein
VFLVPAAAQNENGVTVTFLMDVQRTIKTQIFFVIMRDISWKKYEIPAGYRLIDEDGGHS